MGLRDILFALHPYLLYGYQLRSGKRSGNQFPMEIALVNNPTFSLLSFRLVSKHDFHCRDVDLVRDLRRASAF